MTVQRVTNDVDKLFSEALIRWLWMLHVCRTIVEDNAVWYFKVLVAFSLSYKMVTPYFIIHIS